ncbi:MAG: hypothetical protein ACLP5H_24095 [Desulfomonilaceae bacterium]
MAPYDNAFEVEEYETECDCIGQGQAPDPNCEDCGGIGKHLTTFNPMAKLDGYTIADYQQVLQAAARKPSEWDNNHEDRAGMAFLSDLDLDKLALPQVIVTPSGEWHEMQGDWYSEDRDSADWQEWKRTVKEIYAKWPSAILVVLNCHR